MKEFDFKSLIGAQLVELNKDGFTVVKNNKEYHFYFESDDGDCCGYADIETNFMVDDEQQNRNPIIVDITEVTPISKYRDSDFLIVNFFGEQKQIAKIECETGSGTGYRYGAWVAVSCKETKESKTLVSW